MCATIKSLNNQTPPQEYSKRRTGMCVCACVCARMCVVLDTKIQVLAFAYKREREREAHARTHTHTHTHHTTHPTTHTHQHTTTHTQTRALSHTRQTQTLLLVRACGQRDMADSVHISQRQANSQHAQPWSYISIVYIIYPP